MLELEASPGQRIEQRNEDLRQKKEELRDVFYSSMDTKAFEECRKRINSKTDFTVIADEFNIERRMFDDGTFPSHIFKPDYELSQLEMDNYRDYFQLVGQEVGFDCKDGSTGAYFCSGKDLAPAKTMPGGWFYVDKNLEGDKIVVEDRFIEIIDRDLTDGELPQIDDGSLDLVLIKGVGHKPLANQPNLKGSMYELTRSKLREDGLLATDLTPKKGFSMEREVKPSPEALRSVIPDPYSTPHSGKGVYNVRGISLYSPW